MLAETASLDPCGCSRLPEQDPRPLAAAGQEGGPQRTVQRNLHQIPERQRLNTKDLNTRNDTYAIPKQHIMMLLKTYF